MIIDAALGGYAIGFNSRSVAVIDPSLPPVVKEAPPPVDAASKDNKATQGSKKNEAKDSKHVDHAKVDHKKVEHTKDHSKKESTADKHQSKNASAHKNESPKQGTKPGTPNSKTTASDSKAKAD